MAAMQRTVRRQARAKKQTRARRVLRGAGVSDRADAAENKNSRVMA